MEVDDRPTFVIKKADQDLLAAIYILNYQLFLLENDIPVPQIMKKRRTVSLTEEERNILINHQQEDNIPFQAIQQEESLIKDYLIKIGDLYFYAEKVIPEGKAKSFDIKEINEANWRNIGKLLAQIHNAIRKAKKNKTLRILGRKYEQPNTAIANAQYEFKRVEELIEIFTSQGLPLSPVDKVFKENLSCIKGLIDNFVEWVNKGIYYKTEELPFIHQDIQPNNILWDKNENIVALLDFERVRPQPLYEEFKNSLAYARAYVSKEELKNRFIQVLRTYQKHTDRKLTSEELYSMVEMVRGTLLWSIANIFIINRDKGNNGTHRDIRTAKESVPIFHESFPPEKGVYGKDDWWKREVERLSSSPVTPERIISDWFKPLQERISALEEYKLCSKQDFSLNGRIDLHIHTYYSDGYLTPSQVIFKAWQKGLKAIAITDHDTFEGIEEAMKAGEILGIEVIAGVEFNLFDKELNLDNFHLLSYFDFKNTEEFIKWKNTNIYIQEIMRKTEDLRRRYRLRLENMRKEFNRLHQDKGLELTKEDARRYFTLTPNRHQLGTALLRKYGFEKLGIDNFKELVTKYFPKDLVPFVGEDGLPAEEIIPLIVKAGGVLIIPHPTEKPMFNLNRIKALLDKYSTVTVDKDEFLGIQGIEVYSSKYTSMGEQEEILNLIFDYNANHEIYRRYNLIKTLGSDFHADPYRKIELAIGDTGKNKEGNIKVDAQSQEAILNDLKQRLLLSPISVDFSSGFQKKSSSALSLSFLVFEGMLIFLAGYLLKEIIKEKKAKSSEKEKDVDLNIPRLYCKSLQEIGESHSDSLKRSLEKVKKNLEENYFDKVGLKNHEKIIVLGGAPRDLLFEGKLNPYGDIDIFIKVDFSSEDEDRISVATYKDIFYGNGRLAFELSESKVREEKKRLLYIAESIKDGSWRYKGFEAEYKGFIGTCKIAKSEGLFFNKKQAQIKEGIEEKDNIIYNMEEIYRFKYWILRREYILNKMYEVLKGMAKSIASNTDKKEEEIYRKLSKSLLFINGKHLNILGAIDTQGYIHPLPEVEPLFDMDLHYASIERCGIQLYSDKVFYDDFTLWDFEDKVLAIRNPYRRSWSRRPITEVDFTQVFRLVRFAVQYSEKNIDKKLLSLFYDFFADYLKDTPKFEVIKKWKDRKKELEEERKKEEKVAEAKPVVAKPVGSPPKAGTPKKEAKAKPVASPPKGGAPKTQAKAQAKPVASPPKGGAPKTQAKPVGSPPKGAVPKKAEVEEEPKEKGLSEEEIKKILREEFKLEKLVDEVFKYAKNKEYAVMFLEKIGAKEFLLANGIDIEKKKKSRFSLPSGKILFEKEEGIDLLLRFIRGGVIERKDRTKEEVEKELLDILLGRKEEKTIKDLLKKLNLKETQNKEEAIENKDIEEKAKEIIRLITAKLLTLDTLKSTLLQLGKEILKAKITHLLNYKASSEDKSLLEIVKSKEELEEVIKHL
ncbi:MAG: hypothetical protein DRQ02_09245, partial [Candidatus Latescibacterota bacterium]